MHVTFIPSSNGFGHIKRCIILGKEFSKRGFKSYIWCKQSIFNNILSKISVEHEEYNIDCFDKDIPSFLDFRMRNEYSKSFIREASYILNKMDLIISDNHIEGLLLSNNAILSANFFWHQNRSNDFINDSYYDYCINILKRLNPYVISSELFQDRIAQSYLRIKKIGLIVNRNSLAFNKSDADKKESILISAGMTDVAIKLALDIANTLINNKIYLDKRIFLEPRLFNYQSWPKHVEKATYTPSMYKSLKYAFIRPGLGTISDCLSNYVCPICFNEGNSMEMICNRRIITENKIGYGFEPSMLNRTNLQNLESSISYILKNIKQLNFNGSSDFYKYSINIANK